MAALFGPLATLACVQSLKRPRSTKSAPWAGTLCHWQHKQKIQLGYASAWVAGDLESTSNMLLYQRKKQNGTTAPPSLSAVKGIRPTDGLPEGLRNLYNGFIMGSCADQLAEQYHTLRKGQDKVRSMATSTLPPAFSPPGLQLRETHSRWAMVPRRFFCLVALSRSRYLLVSFISASAMSANFMVKPPKAIEIAFVKAQLTVDQISLWGVNKASAFVWQVNRKARLRPCNRLILLEEASSLKDCLVRLMSNQ